MTDVGKTGFVAIFIDAGKMHENKLPFAVVLDDNKVKAYAVSQENWSEIEKNADIYVKAASCQPLVCLTDGFRETAEQMGWVIVGDVWA